MSIEEALKREDEIYASLKAEMEQGLIRNAQENAWMNNPNPKDHTLQEWIELWHEANQPSTVASEPICEWIWTYNKLIIARY